MKHTASLSKILYEPLIAWHKLHRASLPWRENPTPYRVWISEIMLQQTRIEAVIPYYHRFLEAFPNVQTLAETPEDTLLKYWQGLGYYSRARNLRKAAQTVCAQYGGHLPEDITKLKALAGIGDYTAGAIASIAMGFPEPAVDGNVLRVFMRFTACADNVLDPRVQKRVRDVLREEYPSGKDAGLLTEALMELGETICLPNTAPKCDVCPIKLHCAAYEDKLTDVLPVRVKAKERKVEERTVFILRAGDLYALHKRPKGLLGGLWELPGISGCLQEQAAQAYLVQKGAKLCTIERVEHSKHMFSHIEWHMSGFLAECEVPFECNALRWISASDIHASYAVPTAFRAYMKYIK